VTAHGPAGTASAGDPVLASAVVLGTGLIGTSVALALRERGLTVWLEDREAASAELAAGIGAGALLPAGGPPGGPADVAVLATPPAAVAPALAAAQERGLARCYTDVASVKELPLSQARALGCDLTTYVPGHPLSGRERSGPAAARADLFLGRPWVICPLAESQAHAILLVTTLARECGAQPVNLSPAEHDQWVALVSHAPHLLASAMAARLEQADQGALALAGQGLRDVTRIAAGDPDMWLQILLANAGPVSEVLRLVAADLQQAAAALERGQAGEELAGKELAELLGGVVGVSRVVTSEGWRPHRQQVGQTGTKITPELYLACGISGAIQHIAGCAGAKHIIAINTDPGAPILAHADYAVIGDLHQVIPALVEALRAR